MLSRRWASSPSSRFWHDLTTPDVPTDKLDAMLARLQLGGIRDQLDSLLDEAARSNLSTRERSPCFASARSRARITAASRWR